MHLAFLEEINEDSFEIKCLGRTWKQSPIPDWQKSNFNLYFIQPAGLLYSLQYTLTAWWLWGKQGCGGKKQTAKQEDAWVGREESGNHPQVWLCLSLLCFGPFSTLTSGLLRTVHSSVGLRTILETQCDRQDNWQGRPRVDWSATAEPWGSIPTRLLGLCLPVVCLSEGAAEAPICMGPSERSPVSMKL